MALYTAVTLCVLVVSAFAGTNPSGFLLPGQFGGPRTTLYNGTYYAFASHDQSANGTSPNVPVATSQFLSKGWSLSEADVLPTPGKWVRPGKPNILVPAMHSFNSSYFVMYYTANHVDGSLCVGTATSATILGTYTAQDDPLICDNRTVIEAGTPFVYKDEPWIVYKHNIISKSSLRIQRLSSDGLSVFGPVHQLLHETPGLYDIEGPALTFNPANDGHPILLFAAGSFNKPTYRVMYAYAPTNELVPAEGTSYTLVDEPLLQEGDLNGVNLSGPGSVSFPSLAQFPSQIAFETDRNNNTIVDRSMMTANITYSANNSLSILPP